MQHFFDIGANVGQTFDDYLLRGDGFDGATIWCFEPSSRHVSALRERCDALMESGHNWRINLCPFGLSDRTGWQRLFEKQDPRGDSLFSELYLCNDYIPNRDSAVGVYCAVQDVVDFLFSNIDKDDKVTIKIDAEGSEFKILERILGAPDIWRLIDKLLIEWHSIDSVTGRHEQCEQIRERLTKAKLTVEGWAY